MSEDRKPDYSDLVQALLEIRVRLDIFEDLLAQELHSIRLILEEPGNPREAYNQLTNLIRALESDEE